MKSRTHYCNRASLMQESDKSAAIPAGYRTVRVGGKTFEAHVDTLSKIPYFASLIARFPNSPLVADRDPRGFRHILNYMRDPSYGIPLKWAPEVTFYGLDADAVEAAAPVAPHVPAWYSMVPDQKMDIVNSDTYVAEYRGDTLQHAADCTYMRFVYYKPFDPSLPIEPMSIIMQETNNVHDDPVILCRAQIKLLRALIPSTIRNMLDAYAVASSIHTLVLPSNPNSTFKVHFSDKIACAQYWIASYNKRGMFPHYFNERRYSYINDNYMLYCVAYNETTDEFVPAAWRKSSTDLSWMIEFANIHAATGLPIFTMKRRRPPPMIDGHRVYYFEMGDDAFN